MGVPEGNSRSGRLVPGLAEDEGGGLPANGVLGLRKRKDESHMPIVLYLEHTRHRREVEFLLMLQLSVSGIS